MFQKGVPGKLTMMSKTMRNQTTATLTLALLLVSSPAMAQFGGGKPKIPEQREIDTYDSVVLEDNLNTASVAAGLGGGATLDATSYQETGIDPAKYQGTLHLLQNFMIAVAKVGPKPDVVPRVNLILSERPNAYAKNRENVYVTTGMLDAITDKSVGEDELLSSIGFILAHEYAHVLYDHPAQYQKKEDGVKVGKKLASGVVFAAQMQELTSQISPGLAQANHKATSTLAAATALSPLIELELYRIGVAPYKRQQESRADFLAVDMMRAFAEINPDAVSILNPQLGVGALSVFQTYDNSAFGQLRTGLQNLEDNMKIAGDEIEEHAKQVAATGNPSAFVNQVTGSLAKGALDWAIKIIGRRFNKDDIHVYYSAEKRQEGAELYLDRHYQALGEEVDASAFAALTAEFDIPTGKQITDAFSREFAVDKAAQAARLALASGDVAAARAALDAAGSSGKRSAYFYEIDGAVSLAEGDFSAAEIAYSKASGLPEAGLRAHRELIKTQLAQGKLTAAMTSVDRASAMFGEHELITERLQIMVAEERVEEARDLADARCDNLPEKKEAKQCKSVVPPEEKEKKGLGLGKIL